MKRCGKKAAAALLVWILAAAVIGGCGKELSADFDKAKVEERAKELAELCCTGKTGEAYEKLGKTMKATVTEEQIKAGVEGTTEPLGEFEEIAGIKISSQEDKDTGTEYAVAIVIAKFKDGKAQFTISYNKSMECVGFYIK